MRVRNRMMARSDGRLYCHIDIEAAPVLEDDVWPVVSARRGMAEIPAEVYPAEHVRDARAWVLVLPYFEKAVFDVRVSVGGAYADMRVSCARARFESPARHLIQRARHKGRSLGIERIQASWVKDRLRPSLDRLLVGERGDVWRVCVTWDGAEDVCPRLSITDAQGAAIAFEQYEFERQIGVESACGGHLNRYFYSLRLPCACREFTLSVKDEAGLAAPGFCSCDESFWRFREHESWEHMRDARADDRRYAAWFEEHRAHRGDLEVQRAHRFDREPLFSIVVPCFQSNRQFLSELIDSVVSQSYRAWELVLVDSSPADGVVVASAMAAGDERIRAVPIAENAGIVGNTNLGIDAARGDYIAFLDHDDLLEPDALFWYALEVVRDPVCSPEVLYCDEDLFEVAGVWRQPIFKTRLNVDLLYSHNCVTHFLCVSRELIDRIGMSPEDVAGAQDYDLTLRALAAGARFTHVPRVLYHWREHAGSTSGDNVGSKPYAIEAGRLALERHMASRGVSARAEEALQPFVYRVRYELPEPVPLVSVIIPSRDHADVLRACVGSLFERSTYRAFEVIVVENHSVEPETRDLYGELSEAYGPAFRVLDISDAVEGFNYSRLINLGAAAAAGEYLLLLNNDTEVRSPDFMAEMLGYLQRPEVGVVGAKLYFRDGLTQHAGMLVGPHGTVCHPNQDFESAREGYLSRAVRPGNFSAVTGACQMVRKSVFDEVGGYDEAFAVGFNDVDFCFRVRETGRLVTFTPYAELFHYEFVSRGREAADAVKLERWKREQALFTTRWPEPFLEGDPYSNPNLDPDSVYYGL